MHTRCFGAAVCGARLHERGAGLHDGWHLWVALSTCWTCIRRPLFNKRTLLVALFTCWTCIRLPLFDKRTCLVCSLLGAILVRCGHCVWRAACCGVRCFARGSRGCCGGEWGVHIQRALELSWTRVLHPLPPRFGIPLWCLPGLDAGLHGMCAPGLCCSSCILQHAVCWAWSAFPGLGTEWGKWLRIMCCLLVGGGSCHQVILRQREMGVRSA